uniref:LRRNT domain-containing protein n=1 Tax=Octopus bimaculoides TaxID=37653 RepID=A0A0L8G7T0_OCTBM|eukprot:XP_014783402.1 PREDICTED: leucine-rich repeat-containing protein 15-like [Octopus bimaculoides]
MRLYFWRIFTLFSAIVLPQCAISLGCPLKCSCHGNIVDCIGANLSFVPLNIPIDTKYLNLDNNNIQSLESTPFQNLKMLTRLSLRDNQISSIDEKTFKELPQLSALYLQRNYLHSLNPGTFSGASNLRDLDLSRNTLSDINGIFKNLTNLQNLYISENFIRHLDENSFRDQVHLKLLELSKNLLKKLNLKAFQNLKSLSILKVDQNKIDGISESLPDGIPLQMLDLSRCEMRIFPSKMPKTVQYLNLGMNKLISISRDNLKNLTFLKMLILDNSRINYIEDKAFGGLTNLQELWLNHNAISMFPKYLPPSLTSLVLDYNKIKEIPPSTFPENSALQTISLQGNNLNNISEDAFVDLQNLKELILDDNHLVQIQDRAFSSLTNLETLTLSRCPLRVIKKDAFKGLTKLKQLYMTFVQEPAIEIEDFAVNLPSLEILDIQSSPSLIENITNSESFLLVLNQTATGLKEFNIMNGHLTTLSTSVRTYLSGVRIMKIAGNLWFCDEELITLYKWLATEPDQFIQRDQITCVLPKYLRGVPIHNLTTEEFVEMAALRKIKKDPAEFLNFVETYEERIIVKDVGDTSSNEANEIFYKMTEYCPINNEEIAITDDYRFSGEQSATSPFRHNIIEFETKDSNYMERNSSKINNNYASASEQTKIESTQNSNTKVAKSYEVVTQTKTSNKPSVHMKHYDFTSFSSSSLDMSTNLLKTRIFNVDEQSPSVTIEGTTTISDSPPQNETPHYLKIWAAAASITTMGISLATGSLFYFVLRFRRRKSQTRNNQQHCI